MAVMQSCLPAHFTTYAPSLRHDLFHLPVVRGLLACVSLVLQLLQRVDCRWYDGCLLFVYDVKREDSATYHVTGP